MDILILLVVFGPQVESEDERRNLEINKTVAVEERRILNNLYYNKHRPDLYDKEVSYTYNASLSRIGRVFPFHSILFHHIPSQPIPSNHILSYPFPFHPNPNKLSYSIPFHPFSFQPLLPNPFHHITFYPNPFYPNPLPSISIHHTPLQSIPSHSITSHFIPTLSIPTPSIPFCSNHFHSILTTVVTYITIVIFFLWQNPNLSLHIISNSFLEKWRSFLRYSNFTNNISSSYLLLLLLLISCIYFRRHHFVSRPQSISNQSLLCPHEKFMFKPSLKGEDGAYEE